MVNNYGNEYIKSKYATKSFKPGIYNLTSDGWVYVGEK